MAMFFSSASYAQPGRDEALAKSYFENGEFEKAADLYFGLWEKNAQAHPFYRELIKSYFELNKNDEAQKVIERQIKKFKDNPTYTPIRKSHKRNPLHRERHQNYSKVFQRQS